MNTLMEVQNISKQYKTKKVLDNISFSIYGEEIVALVGKNGCGKSTLLKIIGGIVDSDSGAVTSHVQSLKIGYVPEITPPHVLFTPEEYLFHMGKISGVPRKPLQQKINQLLELFNMQEVRSTRITHFSKGMKQKIMIMQAMLEETHLLILDEPLSGLDPRAQNELENTLLSLKENGYSIILTCHETKLLENLVDRILLMEGGQVVQLESFTDASNQNNLIVFELPSDQSLDTVLSFIQIKQMRTLNNGNQELTVTVNSGDTDKTLLALLQHEATIKQLMPLNSKKEQFHSHF
ncbi:ABC transporter ATP-binding protein [Lysinibacillus sphaericus]|uniref:ABC transporter ATP-binding protein n=2 Tax=Lysinibacillus TaxID=400634 RepID=A0A2S0K2Y2_LYSSH|nr:MULTISPECIES: ABC transporter ATP-binding protein [Lysinibacillus]AHN21184.1 ABC transporter ATP-binding protein [Lysinibacillus varians]AVK97701.1 ABC transporter ATP-binding protein [Lysinibacillus sphaericus]MED4543927.1 ABC transporter ATP-binding protein [Lysinibacillus sphaericus]TKI16101.1 ABC transporter ATP-binding protein [Lysinibacillus sphaericus]TKI59522.1 ABC transporter ATP-binding protein [Lysinibacillus varians]